MVKKIVLVCSTAVIAVLLLLSPLSVSALSSATMSERRVYMGVNSVTWTDTPYSSTWSTSLVSTASSLGFSVVGWEDFFVDGVHTVQTGYKWSADASYLLLFRYVVSISGNTVVNCGYNQSLKDEESRGSYSTTVDFGTYSFWLSLDSYTYTTDSFDTTMIAWSNSIYNGDSFYLSIPVFTPLFADTEEQMLEILEGITGKLDDIADGLFVPDETIAGAVSEVQSTVDDTRSRVDQALSDASIPSFDYSLPEISIDPAPVEPVTDFLEGIPFLVPILAVGVGCWITHLILYGKG